MTTKTLDLPGLLKTFSLTYAHARRLGADRPLSQKFALADVLGEIEPIIAEREKAAAEAAVSAERARVAELTPAPVPTAAGAPRYELSTVAGHVVVRDSSTGRVADMGVGAGLSTVQRYVDLLNHGGYSAAGLSLFWDSSALAMRTRLASRAF